MNDYQYFVVASLVPPGEKGQFSLTIEVDEANYASVKAQIGQRKDKIVFEQFKTGEKISINNQYPVVYMTTEAREKPKNIIIPDAADKRILTSH